MVLVLDYVVVLALPKQVDYTCSFLFAPIVLWSGRRQVWTTYIWSTLLLCTPLPGWERDMGLSPLLTLLALSPLLIHGEAF